MKQLILLFFSCQLISAAISVSSEFALKMSNFEIFESRFYLQNEVSRTNRQFLYYHENKMMYIKNGGVKLCGGVSVRKLYFKVSFLSRI